MNTRDGEVCKDFLAGGSRWLDVTQGGAEMGDRGAEWIKFSPAKTNPAAGVTRIGARLAQGGKKLTQSGVGNAAFETVETKLVASLTPLGAKLTKRGAKLTHFAIE